MRPLAPISNTARLFLGISFFILFFAVWAFATLGGFVSKTFLADPLTMLLRQHSGASVDDRLGKSRPWHEDGTARQARPRRERAPAPRQTSGPSEFDLYGSLRDTVLRHQQRAIGDEEHILGGDRRPSRKGVRPWRGLDVVGHVTALRSVVVVMGADHDVD